MINVDIGHWVFVVTNARPIIGKVISWDHRDPNFKVYTIKTIKGQDEHDLSLRPSKARSVHRHRA